MLHVWRLAWWRCDRRTLLRIGVTLHVRRVRMLAVRMCLRLRVIHHGWNLANYVYVGVFGMVARERRLGLHTRISVIIKGRIG